MTRSRIALRLAVRTTTLALVGTALALMVPSSAGAAEPRVAKKSDEKTYVATMHYATWLFVDEDVDDGTPDYSCSAETALFFPEMKGWEPASVEYYSGSYKWTRTIRPPYDDGRFQHNIPAIPAGHHKLAEGGYAAYVSTPPYKACTDDLAAKDAEYRERYGTVAKIVYYRSAACLKSRQKVQSHKAKVGQAKLELRIADTRAEKAKAKKKLTKAKKKLKKAKKKSKKACPA